MHNNNYCWVNKYMDNKQCSLNQITVSFCQSQNKSSCFCCFGKFAQNTQDVLQFPSCRCKASQPLPDAVCQSWSDSMNLSLCRLPSPALNHPGDVHWGLALSLCYFPLDHAFFPASVDTNWANSRGEWRIGEPGVVQFMGSQRVRQDLVTDQQQNKETWDSGNEWLH